MIGGRQPMKGRKPGDMRIRIERPHTEYFRYSGPGTLLAKAKAHEGRSQSERALQKLRHSLFGRPLASEDEATERLSKTKALAIFSSDAISSSAYATEEIQRALLVGGVGALVFSLPIGIAIAALLAVVAISYRQVCLAYPTGGGSYSVSKANFGRMASLIAASALLIDYTLTVAVSISSASEQIISAIPGLVPFHVVIAVGAVVLITVGNLRGLRESGNLFAAPTYLFVATALTLIAIGLYRILVQGDVQAAHDAAGATTDLAGAAFVLLIVRAFASGAVALTGTEAIATGVPAFKPPESQNAARTLTVMAVLLATLFIGITFLATEWGAIPNATQTVVAQVAAHGFGDGSVGFYLFQAFAALLLILAANTSFAAFPRLAAILAEDGFFPRQFAFRGDRLAFTTGIVILGVVAALLVLATGGSVEHLIPLYAVGVFIDFTISQAGMVKHWLRTRSPGWRKRLPINLAGCIATGLVAIVVTSAKAPASLLVLALIPVLVSLMLFIRREYDDVKRELALKPEAVFGAPARHNRVIIPVPGLSRAVVQSVQFGRTISDDVRAVHVAAEMDDANELRRDWQHHLPNVPLVIVETPYRSLVTPFLSYLDVMAPSQEGEITIVVLPEYVPRHWWDRLLYNQTAARLKRALVGRPDTVVADVPYQREHAV